ncbi:methyltransferase domain-containing protein [Candidatus Poribacteria bacterium]|nr:methyltransferase domain-containing protein [Candidatus Poribacteria bacterium]
MKKVDYDPNLHRNYQKGREHSEATYRLWMEAIAKYLIQPSGLTILDLGCGTGRFSPQLAQYFNACVMGVEPSDKMRAIAEENNAHPKVSYIKGQAEKIPVGDQQCDFAFLSMVIHHFEDLNLCCQELYRALKTHGLVFIRNGFKNRLDTVRFHEFFPGAKEIDNRNLPSLEAVEDRFSANGFEKIALEVIVQESAESLSAYYERIKMRALSTFEFMSDEEFQAGLLAMKRAVDSEKEPSPVTEAIDLLVFKKG